MKPFLIILVLHLITAPIAVVPLGDNYIQDGNKAFEKGNYKLAMQLYSRAKRACDEKDKALNNQSVVLAQHRKHALGLSKLDEAIEINNTNPNYFYNAGLHHLQSNQPEEAIAKFTEANQLGLAPPSGAAYNLALAQYQIDNIQEAITTLAKSTYPDHNNHYLLGHLNFAQEKYSEAATAFDMAAQLHDSPSYTYAAALANHYAGDSNALLGMGDKIKDKKEGANLYTALGNIAIQDHDLESAHRLFKQAIDYNKKYSRAWSGLGVVMLLNQQQKEAKKYFSKSLATDKKNIQALNGLGAILSQQEAYEKANSYYTKTLRIDPENRSALYGAACNYMQIGDPYQCIDHIKKIDKENLSGNALDLATSLHCHALSKVNQSMDAINILNTYIPKYENPQTGLTQLAYIYLKTAQFTKAISTVGTKSFAHEDPYLFAGNAALKMSDHSTAYGYFKKAYAINNENVDVLNGLAMSMVQTYKRNHARTLIDSLYTTYPENFYVANAKGIIYKDIAIQVNGEGFGKSKQANRLLEESERAFIRARDLRPRLSMAINNNRGLSLMYQEKYDEARTIFEGCDMTASKSNLALIDINQGKYKSATRQLSALLADHKSKHKSTIPYLENNLRLAQRRQGMNNNYTFITFYFLHEDRPPVNTTTTFALEEIPGITLDAKPIINYILETSAGECKEIQFTSNNKRKGKGKPTKKRKTYSGKCPKF